MACVGCRVPEYVRRCCLHLCLSETEKALLYKVDGFFALVNVDTECHAILFPCCFEERIREAEMLALNAVLEKTWWGTDDFLSALRGMFTSQTATRVDGWELVDAMVEELKAVKASGRELTKWEVNEAMLSAVSKYTTSAMDQMKVVIMKEYEDLGVAVPDEVKVQLAGGPESAYMQR
eukprot:CAMPEP_0119324180 /NCGR_PEP_ID=MMETSP1333-20130426/62524_1 /TAXON_ID=418940 /ORGANISM="Scyphosphaera apsteinii, Strain RCC1455" /LENGTH=177 /DNA_ID=CAMNT_0007331811 /DNA_START=99 /DNA_END=632 /DNA_ORIENTATION=+